jgi:hypothetical protein
MQRFGRALFRPRTDSTEEFESCHRFRALSASGLYGLAKDVVRVVVEHIDTAALHKIVPPPEKENWGSLKSLEKVVAKVTGEKRAHAALGPLHGIYNLGWRTRTLPAKTSTKRTRWLGSIERCLSSCREETYWLRV